MKAGARWVDVMKPESFKRTWTPEEWAVNCIPEGCACLSHALIYHSRTEAVEALVKG